MTRSIPCRTESWLSYSSFADYGGADAYSQERAALRAALGVLPGGEK